FRSRARWLGHCHFLRLKDRAAWPACCDLDATFDHPPSTVQRSCRMARIPARAKSLAWNACMRLISRARVPVIARSASDEAIQLLTEVWIASRSLSSGARARDPWLAMTTEMVCERYE